MKVDGTDRLLLAESQSAISRRIWFGWTSPMGQKIAQGTRNMCRRPKEAKQPTPRVERGAFSLQVKCSTTELYRRLPGVSIFCILNSARKNIIKWVMSRPLSAAHFCSSSTLHTTIPPLQPDPPPLALPPCTLELQPVPSWPCLR